MLASSFCGAHAAAISVDAMMTDCRFGSRPSPAAALPHSLLSGTSPAARCARVMPGREPLMSVFWTCSFSSDTASLQCKQGQAGQTQYGRCQRICCSQVHQIPLDSKLELKLSTPAIGRNGSAMKVVSEWVSG